MPPAIRVENLGKCYRIAHAARRDSHRTLRESLMEGASSLAGRWRGRGHGGRSEAFWALKGVDFEVQPGEVVGVIGRNGAGKSTLLKVLSRITGPTEGRVRLRGRVGSLLEVGTGFHPELSGRENIYLNGAILGMTRREIGRGFDEIVAFAEVDRFLDTPVKRYSSGMYVRLAFAVAAHLRPEILIVDEVLAVGDATFQEKCLGKMGEVSRSGRTVLFVSHNTAAVGQLTSRCVLLEGGSVAALGPTAEVMESYTRLSRGPARGVYRVEDAPRADSSCRRQLEFLEVALGGDGPAVVAADGPLALRVKVRNKGLVDRGRFSFTIFKRDGTPVGNTFGDDFPVARLQRVEEYELRLAGHRLAPGFYHLGLAVGAGNDFGNRVEYDHVADVAHFEVAAAIGASGARASWEDGWGQVRFEAPSVERVDA